MMKIHCKDKELKKILADAGDAKSVLVEKMNHMVVYVRDQIKGVADSDSVNSVLADFSARLEKVEEEHDEIRALAAKLVADQRTGRK